MADKLTRWQIEVLRCAYTAFDSKLTRGSSAVWYRAPMAIRALVHKRLLELRKRGTEARLTAEGRELVEANPKRFGITIARSQP